MSDGKKTVEKGKKEVIARKETQDNKKETKYKVIPNTLTTLKNQ